MDLSTCGTQFIANFEGFVDHVYDDGTGVATIGYGTTNSSIIALYRDKTCTRDEALGWLNDEVNAKDSPAVNQLDKPFNQAQFDALVSFAYNLGSAIFAPGRSIRTALDGDWATVPDALRLYDKAGGHVLPGLTTRRKAEARLFSLGDYGFACVDADELSPADRGWVAGIVQTELVKALDLQGVTGAADARNDVVKAVNAHTDLVVASS